MENKKRYPTLCSWCRWSVTGVMIGEAYLNKPLPHKCSTYCLKDHFNVDGEDNYPSLTECPDYKPDPSATLSEIEWWKIAWAAKEIDRLELKKLFIETI